MTDITLSPITSGYNVSRINANFEVVKEAINEHILHSDGGNNVMGQDIDMNSNRVFNLPAPIQGHEALRLQDLVAVDSGNAIELQVDLADTTDPLKGVTKVGRATVTTDSVFSLLDVEPREDQAVIVKGYLPGSTIGGGEFRWNPVRVKSQHDGGTAISPTVPWDGTTGAALTAFLAGTGETNPGGAGCWERLGEALDIVHFGATPTASVDNFSPITKAITVAFAKKTQLNAAAGTFEYGTVLDLSYPTLVFRGAGMRNTVLKFTGTGSAANALGDRPNNGAFSFDFDMSDMTIEGNANATSLLQLRINHARLRDLNFREASSTTGVALRIQGVVAGHFQNITCSTNTQLMVNRPLRGLTIDEDPTDARRATDNTFINVTIEGMMEDGIQLIKSDFSTFIGGTSENNTGIGVSITAGSKDNTCIGMCFENAGFADVFDDGECNKFLNCYGTTAMNVGPNAQFHTTDGGFWNSVFEDAGAEYSTFQNIRYNFLFPAVGTFVLNSTSWSARNIYSVQGVQYVTPKKPVTTPVVGASPWTYTNVGSTPVTLTIGGGADVVVDLTRNGTAMPAGAGGGAFYIPQGDSATVAFTSTPTAKVIAEGANFS